MTLGDRRQKLSIALALAVAISSVAIALATVTLPRAAAASDPVIGAAGDVACDSTAPKTESCHQRATADLLAGRGLDAVLGLGDLQYERGALDAFQRFYDPTWGRVKSITRPAPGNHEYEHQGCAAATSPTSARRPASPATAATTATTSGAWHLIALNSNCDASGLRAGSPQVALAQVRPRRARTTLHARLLARTRTSPPGRTATAARPTTSGTPSTRRGADVVLNGHDHDYERFAPQTPQRQAPTPPTGSASSWSGPAARNHYAFAHDQAEQPGPQRRHLRRPAADAPRRLLRLALRPRGRQDVHRLRDGRLPRTSGDAGPATEESWNRSAFQAPVPSASPPSAPPPAAPESARASSSGGAELRSRLLRRTLAPERSVKLDAQVLEAKAAGAAKRPRQAQTAARDGQRDRARLRRQGRQREAEAAPSPLRFV